MHIIYENIFVFDQWSENLILGMEPKFHAWSKNRQDRGLCMYCVYNNILFLLNIQISIRSQRLQHASYAQKFDFDDFVFYRIFLSSLEAVWKRQWATRAEPYGPGASAPVLGSQFSFPHWALTLFQNIYHLSLNKNNTNEFVVNHFVEGFSHQYLDNG